MVLDAAAASLTIQAVAGAQILTTDPLPDLARLSLQFTVLPFIIALWFHNRSLTGWAFATAVVLWYEFSVRVGQNVDNVLNLYTGLDATQAQHLYNFLFPLLTLVCSLFGTGVAYLLDLPYVLEWAGLMPESPGLIIAGRSSTSNAQEQVLTQKDGAISAGGLIAYGYTHIRPPYVHCLVTLLGFIVAVPLSFILYEQIYAFSYWGAYLVAVLVPLVAYLLLGLYWRYQAALSVFGPDEQNLKRREQEQMSSRKQDDGLRTDDPDLSDQQLRAAVFARTHYNVWKMVLVAGGLHEFLFILIAGVATFENDNGASPAGQGANVNVVWILALCVIGGLTVLVAIVAIIYSVVTARRTAQQTTYAGTIANGSGQQQQQQPAPNQANEEEGEQTEGATEEAGEEMTTQRNLLLRSNIMKGFLH